MSRQDNSTQRKGHPLLAGILIGMVFGLLAAGGIAWYITKTPSPFVENVPHSTVKLEPDAPKSASSVPDTARQGAAAQPQTAQQQATSANSGASGNVNASESPATQGNPAPQGNPGAASADGDKPRFEFYKVLTDGQQAAPPAKTGGKSSGDSKPSENKPSGESKPSGGSKPTPPKDVFYLQAGAFAEAGDADRLKARLAMMGLESTVLDTSMPDKTELHRVRLGPYSSVDEMNKAAALLKQNNIISTPMR